MSLLGGFEAGSVYAKLGALVDESGFKKFDRAVDKADRAQATATLKADVDTSGFDRFVARTRAATTEYKRLNKEIDHSHGSILKLGNVFKLLGVAAIPAAIGAVAQAFSSLAAGAVALTGALGPLSGALVVLPGLYGAVGQAAGVVALSGVKDLTAALGGNAQALKRLSPEARKFYDTLKGLKPQYDSLKKAAQAPLFSGFDQGLRSALKNLPVFRRMIRDTSGVLGDLAKRMGSFLGSKQFGGEFAKIARTNEQTLSRLGKTGIYLAGALTHVMVAARPLLDWMTKGILHSAKLTEAWAKQGEQSGRMAGFFEKTRAVMERLFSISGHLAKALFEVGKAGAPLGNEILASFDRAAKRFEDWTKSLGGQNALKKWFADAKPGLYEMGRLIADITKAFLSLGSGGQTAPFIRSIRTQLLPLLTQLVGQTTAAFGPHLIKALAAFGRVILTIAGPNGPLTVMLDVLTDIAKTLKWMLDNIPGAKGLFFLIVGMASVAKAISFAAAISGMKRLIVLAQSARTVLLGTAAAGAGVGVATGTAGGLAGGGRPSTGPGAVGFSSALPAAEGAGIGAALKGVFGKMGPALKFLGKATIWLSIASGIIDGITAKGGFRDKVQAAIKGTLGTLTFGLTDSLFPDKAAQQAKNYKRTLDDIKNARAEDLATLRKILPWEEKVGILSKSQAQAIRESTTQRERELKTQREQAKGQQAAFDFLQHAIKDRRFSGSEIDQFTKKLSKLGPTARDAGKSYADNMSRQLERAGKLASGETNKLTDGVTRRLNTMGRRALRNLTKMANGFGITFDSVNKVVQAGMNYVGLAVGDALTALGGRKFSLKVKNPKQLGRLVGNVADILGQAYAGGGILPSQGTRADVMTLLDRTGRPVAKMAGNEAILNSPQQRITDFALRAVGIKGLHGLFGMGLKHMAGGGPLGFASGGFFPAPGTDYSYGQEPEIARRLGKLGRARGLHLVGISGHRTPQHSVEVGGFANDPHTRGEASDTPGIEAVTEAILEKYGLTRPFGGAKEADHIQLLGGGKGGRIAGAVAEIKRMLVGPPGALADVAQGAIDKVRGAANSFLGKQGPVGAGASAGGLSGGTSGANQALGRKMMLDAGYPESEWPALKALWEGESGWDANSVNPSSGAYGIPQALGHGHPFELGDASGQIAWGLDYIKGRYGTPSAAYSTWQSRSPHWYNSGGFLNFAGGGFLGDAIPAFGGGGHVGKPKTKHSGSGKGDKKTKVKHFKLPSRNVNLPDWGQGIFENIMDMQLPVLNEDYDLASEDADLVQEEFFIPDPAKEGQQIVDWPAVDIRKDELGNLIGRRSAILTKLDQARGLAVSIIEQCKALIAQQIARLEQVLAQFKANVKRLARLRDHLRDELKKKRRNKSRIDNLRGLIGAIEAENRRLGGDSDKAPSEETEDGSIYGTENKLLLAARDLKDGGDGMESRLLDIQGYSGRGGLMNESRDEIAKWQTELGGLDPTAITTQLAELNKAAEPAAEPAVDFEKEAQAFLAGLKDLQTQFGSNFKFLGSFGSGGRLVDDGFLFGHKGELIVNPQTAEARPSEPRVIEIVNNNHFAAPPPDPHSWSRAVGFELRAAV